MLPEAFRSIRWDQKWVSNKLIPSLDIGESQYPSLRRYCRIHQFKRFWEQNWVESVFAMKAKWGRHPLSLARWSQMILMHHKLFKKQELIVRETVHRNDMGTIAWNPVSWWLALASLQSVVLEGGSISVKSPSLIVIDGSEPKRLKFSDRYLEIWRNGSGSSLCTLKRQKWLRC